MRNVNERPICHRAEDLVTYLYGEATQAEARDFSSHLEQCESCKAEFAVFRQVHNSILEWRSEALGTEPRPKQVARRDVVPAPLSVQRSTRLSAVAALRQFFSVSPPWLRGAAGFAALLLFMLLGLSAARLFRKPPEVSNEYTRAQIKAFVDTAVEAKMAKMADLNSKSVKSATATAKQPERHVGTPRTLTASNRQRAGRRLSREEREQLEASLRLNPTRDDDELPFVFTREPNW